MIYCCQNINILSLTILIFRDYISVLFFSIIFCIYVCIQHSKYTILHKTYHNKHTHYIQIYSNRNNTQQMDNQDTIIENNNKSIVPKVQIITVQCLSPSALVNQKCVNSSSSNVEPVSDHQLNDEELQRVNSVKQRQHLQYEQYQIHGQQYQQGQQYGQDGVNVNGYQQYPNVNNNQYHYPIYYPNQNLHNNYYYQQPQHHQQQQFGYSPYHYQHQHHRNPYSQQANPYSHHHHEFPYMNMNMNMNRNMNMNMNQQGCQYSVYNQCQNQVASFNQGHMGYDMPHYQQNQQFSHKRQRCGREFRGRGWHKGGHRHHHKKRSHSSSSSSSISKSKNKTKCQKKCVKENQNIKNVKIEGHTSNSSEDELKLLQGKMENLNMNQQKKIEEFISCLKPFLEKNNLKQHAKYRIGKYLSKKFLQLQELDPLISVLYGLQAQSPQIFTNTDYTLFLIVKQIIKKNYNIEAVKQSLAKKSKIKQKRLSHDLRFQEQYPDAVQLDFLEQHQLLQLNLDKTLFLVDGNNVMPKQKIFRKYFQSDRNDEKAQGQIRLQWLLSESLNSQVFFDNKYDQKLYNDIKYDILSKKQQQNLSKVPIHFADKQLDPNNTADMKIVSRLSEIAQDTKYQGYTIVLVSADQELGQLCNAIYPIKKTSGRYIFKFCKKVIKRKYYNSPEMKGIIRDIFLY